MHAGKLGASVLAALIAGPALAYEPPPASKPLLGAVDFAAAQPLDEAYRREFVKCDGGLAGGVGKNTFMDATLVRPHLCATITLPDGSKQYGDPSKVAALLKLKDGGIYFDAKMALDVDGSWAAWNGRQGATDLKCTSYSWVRPNSCSNSSTDPAVQANQIDPDRFPFVVMPTAGFQAKYGGDGAKRGQRFAKTTGLAMGDMGVAFYKNRWVPVFIADGGPFMRLGEGSPRVFEELGESRCKAWNADKTICTGGSTAPAATCKVNPAACPYPYRNSGIGGNVLYILYPGSRDATMTPGNAKDRLCAFAKAKLNLTGGSYCPP